MLEWDVRLPDKPRASSLLPKHGTRVPTGPRTSIDYQRVYDKKKHMWFKLAAIDPCKPELGSWLEEASRTPTSQRRWGIGCLVCRRSSNATSALKVPWASLGVRGKSIRTWSIRRHMESQSHKDAIKAMYGTSIGNQRLAPDLDQFLTVLKNSRQGLPHNGTQSVGGRHKICQMRWCLAEAIKDIERAHVKKSNVVALHQDAREQLFLMRYSAVTPDLKIMRGVLGVVKNFGTTSDDICKTVITVCKDFCSPRLSPPSSTTGHRHQSSVCDLELYNHLRSIVELMDADGASDEQRAMRLLQGKAHSVAIGNQTMFPNLKIVLRDRTHAATRHHHCTMNLPCAPVSLSAVVLQLQSTLHAEADKKTVGRRCVLGVDTPETDFGQGVHHQIDCQLAGLQDLLQPPRDHQH